MKTASWFTPLGPEYQRIGISRGTPRGHPAGYQMFRTLAPGDWFKNIDRAEYEQRFQAEVLDPLNPQRIWDMLQAKANGREPVLLCFERPPFTATNWCHRRLVAAWFERHLEVRVPEFGYEDPPLILF